MSWAYQLSDGWMCEQFHRGRERERKWKPFQPSGTAPKYSRDRVVDVKHLKLTVRLDCLRKSLDGVAELTVRALGEEVKRLELDAVDLCVTSVKVDGKAAAFENTGLKLALDFPKPLDPARDALISVKYSARPRRGLYFIGPERRHARKRREVWSQGEDEDNRHWFPCFDYPNEKATSELIATVPGKWFCLSNGRLLERRRNRDGTATFHWLQELPHVSYLITLCAGEYTEVKGEWDGIPVNYYVPPGREEDGERSFGRTPEMVRHYSELIGVRYPFAKYAQITATDFIFGGMENTSATTQTDRTLHDARAHLDFSSEPLVAHELVHSWFGNLVTCRDWSHAWLNESFASLFDNLWYRHSRGEDEFRYELHGDWRAYLDEDRSKYRRPIVTNVYREPMDLFDRHLYQKGANVLNLLRNLLGDRAFFKAVKLYVERHREGCVVTQDLLKAFEDATGRNFDWLFEQWIYKGGHPEFEVSAAWDAAAGTCALTIRQKQTPDELTSIFRLPVKVRFVGRGYDETRTFELKEAEHVCHAALPSRPRWLAFDPGNTIPKTVSLKFDADQLAAQLAHDDDAMGRVHAAQALAEKGTLAAVQALGKGLRKDRFWGVQAECAAALARVHSPEAREELLTAAHLRHPKARRAVARALSAWRDSMAVRALSGLARRDASYFVEAEATEGLGKTRLPRLRRQVLQALRKDSHLDVIRGGAFGALVELDAARALPILEEWSKAGRPEQARQYALGLLGRAARETGREPEKLRVRRALEQELEDGGYYDRHAALRSLRDLRDPAAIPALARLAEAAHLDGRLKRVCEETMAALRQAAEAQPELRALREELDGLKTQTRKLQEQLEKLAARRAPRPKAGK